MPVSSTAVDHNLPLFGGNGSKRAMGPPSDGEIQGRNGEHDFQKPLGMGVPRIFGVHRHLTCLERQVPNAVCGCVDLGSDMPKDAPAAELLKR